MGAGAAQQGCEREGGGAGRRRLQQLEQGGERCRPASQGCHTRRRPPHQVAAADFRVVHAQAAVHACKVGGQGGDGEA